MPETPESPKELPPAEVTAASAVTIASAHECETPQTAHVPKPTKENAPMLDVHPAHPPAHSWRDFFVHIATICVGLLIAIALEQTVEAVDRHHERAELRAALDKESRQVLADTEQVRATEVPNITWVKQVTAL